MTGCIHCGIHIPLYNKGYLYVKSDKELNPFDQMEIPYQRGYYQLSYTSSEALAERMESWTARSDFSAILAGLSQTSDQPHPDRLIPFGELLNRLKNKKVIDFIQTGNMVAHLQPIINLQNMQLYGYESLLRSGSKDENYSPMEIFRTANETGLHSLLDQRAREAAIKTRKEKVPADLKSFINFLPSTIYNPEFCLKHTFKIVDAYGVDPANLVFEVVETENIVDVPHLKNVLDTYKREGMKVALDDVGSGFATVEMLKKLQPDYVKVDRSYISFCDQDEQKQQFLHEVLSISNGLGITMLAEGMERQEEMQYCQSIGIPLAQGYYIGKPSPEALVPNLI
ncbi:EAL domain-containing protein (putative c-di-GMP-specific phosphodiesterase class I) [Bacillus ectoiniformans]|uniref:EAL domain-containing protein n=1 Tax=Bacillus ectoiniformans TaxID=1494429 RepID=UPI00195D642B|nr:EAL domain-containing protein [Bacillus ectoiniformans]MBM7647335.1 EAL domain-containing protein (putative c-di-GMP-specific phosphodiesterase class I) [Bacillus ectoiniformans]